MSEDHDKQQIREVIAGWMRATAEGNVDHVLTLMAEDVVFLQCAQPPLRGRQAFAAATRGALDHVQIEGKSDIQEIHLSGDYAFCWNHLSITVTPRSGAAPKHREGNVLSVFRKESDGRWVLFRDANLLSGG